MKDKLRIKDKILNGEVPTLLFFGDSITEGCFEFNEDFSDTTFKPEYAYPSLLKRDIEDKLGKRINLINAGKSGNNTVKALKRFENDVLAKNPDFVLIMFGANDVVNIYWKQFDQNTFYKNMKYFIDELRKRNIEVVLMTPNMMAKYDKGTLVNTKYQETLADCIFLQNNGAVDKFFEDELEFAKNENVDVIDVYSIWKKMDKDGIDTTALLINDVNHPNYKMQQLFADEIYKYLFG